MNKFKKLDQDTEKLIKATAKAMDKKTDQTATKIKRALDEAFTNWAKDGLLTSDEMRKYRRASKLDKAITDIIKDGRSITDDEIKKLTQAAAKETVHICLMNKKKIRVRAIKRRIDLDEIINDTVAGRHWKERTQHISANLTYDILSQVKKGIANGEPYHQMAKSIDRVMGAYKGRPEVIARTETHRIIEHTKHQAMTEVNKEIKQYKIWHSVGDERVRDSHAQMDGQKVPIDQPFIFPSGAQAMYPGGSGVAGEDINCRCFVEYVDEVDINEENEDQADEVVEKTEKTGYKEDKDVRELIKKVKELDIKNANKDDIIEIGESVNNKFNVGGKIGDKDELKSIFSKFREFGNKATDDTFELGDVWDRDRSAIVKNQLCKAFDYYPKEWSKIPKNTNTKLYVRMSNRGYFAKGALHPNRQYSHELGANMDGYITIVTDGKRKSTPFHEIGHMVEWSNKDVVRIEKEFIKSRTKGEEPVRMMDLFPGFGYDPDEVTLKDNFISPYIGKHYEENAEVLSVGLAALFEPGQGELKEIVNGQPVFKSIADDQDFLNLIIGLILKG